MKIMTEGFFNDPAYPDVRPKIACIVPLFIRSQDYGHFKENKLETLQIMLKAHKHFKPGVDYDLIFINRGAPVDLPGETVIEKPNEGFSFGAWKQAWEEFGDKYDFYLFTEDDLAPAKDGWLLEILAKFMSSKNIGAVGNFVEGRSSSEEYSREVIWPKAEYKRDMMYNFDGSYTFTSSKILKQVDAHGGLMVFPCEPHFDLPATVNECLFQLPILELGYKIVSFDAYVVHGSELFTGDVAASEDLPIGPLMNVNGRHKIPKVREIFKEIL